MTPTIRSLLHFFSLFSVLFLLPSSLAFATDLVSIFKQAEKNDPIYQESIAIFEATLESKPQAKALLLPSVNFTAGTFGNRQSISQNNTSTTTSFNSHNYGINVSQPIFNRERLIGLELADLEIKQAAESLEKSKQELMLRVISTYFEVLASYDDLDFAIAEKESLFQQLEQATQRFDVGLTAITDVQEAQAGYDRAIAQEIQAQNAVDNAREALREIIGGYENSLQTLGSDMPLEKPIPNTIEAWTDIALQNNQDVNASLYNLETAKQEIKNQKAGHLPTLDLNANHGYDSSGGRFGAAQIHNSSIGIEFNLPLYQGGLISSNVRQAIKNHDAAAQQLETARRSSQRSTREAFNNVMSGISEVKALEQALKSSETALEATEAGFQVGTRTAVDVVNSERTTSSARRDFSRAKYNYIVNLMSLKQSAGILNTEDISLINQWLDNHTRVFKP